MGNPVVFEEAALGAFVAPGGNGGADLRNHEGGGKVWLGVGVAATSGSGCTTQVALRSQSLQAA
jgi:hypothetical protein